MGIEELKKAIKEKELIIGSNQVIERLKAGKIKEVFLSRDCSEVTKKDIQHYNKISKIKIDLLDVTAVEIGALCKKQFSISVLGY